MNITFLGLGIMGSRMAKNLIDKGVEVTVWNRSPQACTALHEKGASVALSAKAAVADADIVFSMLSNPEVVESLFFGDSGLLSAMKERAIWSDASTVNPSFSRRAADESAKYQIQFTDSPVAGSKVAAQSGQLIFFCGADQQVYETCLPYYEMMGQKGMLLGTVGQGSALKMLVNGMLAQNMAVFSETVILGEKLGLNKEMLLSMFPNLPVMAPFTQHKTEAIRNDNYGEVSFPLEHMHKDIRLANLTAQEVGMDLHLAESARKLFEGAEQAGKGKKDFGALHQYLEEINSK